MFIGLVLIVIGAVFFAKALGYFDENTIDVLWPLLLIVLGLGLLGHRMASGCGCRDSKQCEWHKHVSWGDTKKTGKRRKK